ncbi:phage-related protein [Janthinobacterium sp. Marseille]|nr:phage-related protein [Janthinobacterium sp. Marseille]
MCATPLQRLEKKYVVTPSCWIWTGSSRRGYGLFWLDGKVTGAHRAAYELYVGPIKDGLHVCHRCDNRSCVNPAHMFLGTNHENVADRQTKGRSVLPGNQGESNGMARLTASAVKKIRLDERDLGAIAADHSISRKYVGQIKRGQRWKHV